VLSTGGRFLDRSGVGGLEGSFNVGGEGANEKSAPINPETAAKAAASPASIPGDEMSLSVVLGTGSAFC
jgi:hypothetical protein